MTPKEKLEKDMKDYDNLINMITEAEEYLYNWCQIYTGKYNYVDHSRWTETCLRLFQKYKFDINKIKEDILNETIMLPKYTTNNPKLIALEQELYKRHKEKVEEFEAKHLNDE